MNIYKIIFKEAYKMVNAAEERKDRAERLLAEAHLKLDLLQAEVLALKSVVKNTTPPTTPARRSSKGSIAQRFINNAGK